jgi:hypothetical protein
MLAHVAIEVYLVAFSKFSGYFCDGKTSKSPVKVAQLPLPMLTAAGLWMGSSHTLGMFVG